MSPRDPIADALGLACVLVLVFIAFLAASVFGDLKP